jgi:thiamine-phosphate pyrophosphorylase
VSTSPLPAVLVLTDRRAAAAAGHALTHVVAACTGLDVAVVVREKDLPGPARAVLAAEVADAARAAGVALVVASDELLAAQVGARGLHLAATDAMPVGWDGWVGRSCHDHNELGGATADGVDYVTVSPVYETSSKPGYGPALGTDGLRRLASGSTVPVYALAGVDADTAGACVAAGAYGVAVQGAVMGAPDPGDVVARTAAAVHAARREGALP